jgi:hypothetical protein
MQQDAPRPRFKTLTKMNEEDNNAKEQRTKKNEARNVPRDRTGRDGKREENDHYFTK